MTTATKASHTPGPWQVGYYRGDQSENFLSVWAASVQVGETGNPVCLISPSSKEDARDEANARLIAAAPEMLALIKESLEPVGVDRRQGLRDEMHKLILRVEGQ